jgi:hypothetical protein
VRCQRATTDTRPRYDRKDAIVSDDPETARQIAELSRDTRPLLVLDVDEVLLEFVRPFTGFLNARQLDLKTTSLRLHGNVIEIETGTALANERVTELLGEFYEVQANWQTAAERAAPAIAALADQVEIVLLTAMPHRHRDARRAHLDLLGFHYPLVTTERAKGPAIRQLRGDHPRPIAFVDDMLHNLLSVQATVPDAHLFHLMMHPEFRAMLPPLPEGVVAVEDWDDAASKIAAALGVHST